MLYLQRVKLTRLLLLLTIITAFSCTDVRGLKRNEIISKAIEAHGGLESWIQTKSIKYNKRTIMYFADGTIESDVTQSHFYQLHPKLSGTISWLSGVDTLLIAYENDSASHFVNGVELKENSVAAKTTFLAAYYTFCQPFKLKDEGTAFTELRLDTLEDGKLVKTIKVEYPQATKADTWWYYFDPKTLTVEANMVDHGKGISYIRNLGYDKTSGLIFNSHRKSYNVDASRNIQYLRAEYFNTNIEVERIEPPTKAR